LGRKSKKGLTEAGSCANIVVLCINMRSREDMPRRNSRSLACGTSRFVGLARVWPNGCAPRGGDHGGTATPYQSWVMAESVEMEIVRLCPLMPAYARLCPGGAPPRVLNYGGKIKGGNGRMRRFRTISSAFERIPGKIHCGSDLSVAARQEFPAAAGVARFPRNPVKYGGRVLKTNHLGANSSI